MQSTCHVILLMNIFVCKDGFSFFKHCTKCYQDEKRKKQSNAMLKLLYARRFQNIFVRRHKHGLPLMLNGCCGVVTSRT